MIESTGTFLEYEAAYRAERLRGVTAPRRAEHPRPATARFAPARRGDRAVR